MPPRGSCAVCCKGQRFGAEMHKRNKRSGERGFPRTLAAQRTEAETGVDLLADSMEEDVHLTSEVSYLTPLFDNKIRTNIEKEVGQSIPDYLLPQLGCFASFGVEVPELVKLTKSQLVSNDSRGKVLKIPEDILRERLSWYNECFDLTGKELGKALTRDPRILQCSPETTTAKRVQYLARRGVDKQQLTKVFKKSPQFFRLDVTKSMEPRFQFLEQLGIPKAMHPALLVKDPAIMNRSISSMEENALFLLEIGFDAPSLQLVLVKHPSLLRYNRKSMKKIIYFFTKLGITKNERVVLISRLPQVFSMSLERNLMAKFSYFLRTLGWSVHDLSMSPQVLSLSLKGRILGRHQFLVQKGLFDYFKDFKRRRWLLVKDAVFATSIAKCSEDEYKQFLKNFLKETKSTGRASASAGKKTGRPRGRPKKVK
ncbi:hypothetical protein HOP50_06g41170 [Chloropicon primus]|nr:hypothetical protein A3770_06p41080 [Chloropicon primus]UPR00801.1 hypothetical protein HOP50_06g41170 [Chloropicon primus]|eukprot:QDZ21590.1 hypothetical protein A3770_06p41080 [Chloropicon primus]